MTFDINDVVILDKNCSTQSEDFVGRIIGFDGDYYSERLKLQPLSVDHPIYRAYPRDYIVSNCGFYINIFVNKSKTRLVQLLLEGCVYEI